ncbi:TPA: MFS transporter, partial [Klebsiella variicola subsp. variicola]
MAINSSTIASSSPSRIHPAGLLSIGLGSILSSLDLFVVNLAFPSISRSFPEHPEATLSLILTIFSVCFASTLVLSGRFADRYGRRTIFSVGLVLFGLSSLLCGLAP